ncbi:hypothetical protein GLOIN_2v1571020 [Rhizophagus clarus]|uniref:Uncharacterized protein n=1 Tax=Rhizophagus clarus TaxID=94130 RepID=A0A8H3QD52_9GLOM|nr:hypothetical protein GLOIN_2v1571020 [Rhizophagus clarus]
MLRQKTLSYGRFTLSSELELVNTKINVNIKEDLGVEELPPLSKISKHFTSQPADEHICIIVQRPVETKEVYCNSRFRTSFTFPDGTGDEHIVINRECGGNEKEIIYLVDDEDLTGVIWTQGLKVDLPIVVDTCTRNSHFRSGHFPRSRRYSVLHDVVSCYDGEVKVCPEYELSGSYGKGPVDWVIKIGDTIIVVTEAKREGINQRVGQNAIQLQASSQRKKRNAHIMRLCVKT